jgi:hypothetical protein
VRAHDQQRAADGSPDGGTALRRACEVDAVEVVLVLDLERQKALCTGSRRRDEHVPAALRPAVGTPYEEESRGAEHVKLLAQVLLQPRREQAVAERVAPPRAAVLDQEPVVDAARGRRERLSVRP